MKNTVDAIIVGQGLAGSALAWELLQRGKKVMVYDEPELNRASSISAGICNPITGKVMSKTYLADQLFPYLNTFYSSAEKVLQKRFFHSLPLFRPFLTEAEQRQWKEKATSSSLQSFITDVRETPWRPELINNSLGGLVIGQAGYMDVVEWVSTVRERLMAQQAYRAEHLDERLLVVKNLITYRDITSPRIIFCNGMAAKQSEFFHWVPLRPLKGETITVRTHLEADWIVSRGVYLVPGREAHTFVVGSTYQHSPFEERPSDEAYTYLVARLAELIVAPFEVIHQDWGIRPTVTDRRPLLGRHPAHGNVFIFNGLGTKGVSLAPYFARALANEIDNGTGLPSEVNIARFKSLYSK